MTGTQYERGRRFEYKVADLLEADGYVCVRAAGSKGPADVVACKPGQTVFVSCKIGGVTAVPREEWNAFLDAADRAGALAVVASRPAHGKVAYHRVLAYRAVLTRIDGVCEPWTPDQVGHG